MRRGRPPRCGPGGFALLSRAHLGVKHLLPLSINFSPLRRHNRQTAAVYLATSILLNSSSLWRTTAIMRNRGHISDTGNMKPCALKRPNSRLTPTARPFNIDIYLTQAVLHSFSRRLLSCQLSSIGSAFARAFKSGCARTSPGENIPLEVSKSYYSIIKGRLNIRLSCWNRFALPSFFTSFLLRHSKLSFNYVMAVYFLATPRLFPLPATVLREPRLVRALVRVRCPLTGRP